MVCFDKSPFLAGSGGSKKGEKLRIWIRMRRRAAPMLRRTQMQMRTLRHDADADTADADADTAGRQKGEIKRKGLPLPPPAVIPSLRGLVAMRRERAGSSTQEHSTAQHSQQLFSTPLTSTKSPAWRDRRGTPQPTPPPQPPTPKSPNLPARAVQQERGATGVGWQSDAQLGVEEEGGGGIPA